MVSEDSRPFPPLPFQHSHSSSCSSDSNGFVHPVQAEVAGDGLGPFATIVDVADDELGPFATIVSSFVVRVPAAHHEGESERDHSSSDESSLVQGVQAKPKNNGRSWTDILRETQVIIEVKDSDCEEVPPPGDPEDAASSGLQRTTTLPGGQQAKQAEAGTAQRQWKYAKAARAQEAHEGVQPLAAAARGRGLRALCKEDMVGVIAGHHMITSWDQAFFRGIQQEEGNSPAPAGVAV